MERELTQDIRIRAGTMRALFHQDLNIGDRIQFAVSRQYLSANMDTRGFAVLLEQQVQNHTVSFKDEMPIPET
jgi:hypothetical protein